MTNEEMRRRYFEAARSACTKGDFAFLEGFKLGSVAQHVLQESIAKAVNDGTFPSVTGLSAHLGNGNGHLSHLKGKGLIAKGDQKNTWVIGSLVFAELDKQAGGDHGELKTLLSKAAIGDRVVLSPEKLAELGVKLNMQPKDLKKTIDELVSQGVYTKGKRPAGFDGFILICKEQPGRDGDTGDRAGADRSGGSSDEEAGLLTGQVIGKINARINAIGDEIAANSARMEDCRTEIGRLQSEIGRLETRNTELQAQREKKIQSKKNLETALKEALVDD